MPQCYLQRRWGGYVLCARERLYGDTIACGTWAAMYAALRLLNPPTPGKRWDAPGLVQWHVR